MSHSDNWRIECSTKYHLLDGIVVRTVARPSTNAYIVDGLINEYPSRAAALIARKNSAIHRQQRNRTDKLVG